MLLTASGFLYYLGEEVGATTSAVQDILLSPHSEITVGNVQGTI